MKTKDLISELTKYNPDIEVVVPTAHCYGQGDDYYPREADGEEGVQPHGLLLRLPLLTRGPGRVRREAAD